MNESHTQNLSSDIFSTPFLLANVGAPFLIGMATGYFAKKMLKTALFFGGAIVVLLFVAESQGIITINSMALQDAASSTAEMAKDSSDFLLARLGVITGRGVSAVGGFYAGFKLG
ncbi:FUN14 domain-containing protein [Methylomonas sp. SURF-2]|uniref:FUN14 domain-containing protein n=1 Tax=Methylomonas subterranea TaxID=2952225 RepID=A0ABT1TE56_9GAMM|nr:FUN14 domain-containing protein [Methylomonas sp. SURF-2]MCQ8103739.1 FUN14 domain-containing protein [Methylomonas sp. SURF-2]